VISGIVATLVLLVTAGTLHWLYARAKKEVGETGEGEVNKWMITVAIVCYALAVVIIVGTFAAVSTGYEL